MKYVRQLVANNVLDASSPSWCRSWFIENSTETRLLGRGVDGDKDQVGLSDTLVNFGGEEQVSATTSLDDVNETGLVDGEVKVGVVPGVDTGLVQVDNGDLDLRTLESAVK